MTLIPIPLNRNLETIEYLTDEILVKDSWICGGFALHSCNPYHSYHQYKDIDIFVKDQTVFDSVCDNLECSSYTKIVESPNAITYDKENEPQVQVIRPKLYNSISLENVLHHFDISICAVGIDANGKAYATPEGYYDMISLPQQFRLVHIRNPFHVMNRVQKYLRHFDMPENPMQLLMEYCSTLSPEQLNRYWHEFKPHHQVIEIRS